MIKVLNSIPVIALLLACASAASAAAPASPQPPLKTASCSGAMSQLMAAVPGGPDALDAVRVSIPAPNLSPRSEPRYNVATIDLSAADAIIKEAAASTQKSGKLRASQLFIRLLNEGTPEEKLGFANGTGKTYAFPKRFYWRSGIVEVKSACRRVAELFCWVACTGLGENRKCAEEQCKIIIVDACP